jgi:hypothetical protein
MAANHSIKEPGAPSIQTGSLNHGKMGSTGANSRKIPAGKGVVKKKVYKNNGKQVKKQQDRKKRLPFQASPP